jgi:phosphate transport system substrate-binding protein
MKRFVMIGTSFVIAGFLMASVCGAQENTAWKIGGANLYSDAFERLAGDFDVTKKGCKPVILGSTTGRGISELLNGEVSLVAASRALNAGEKQQAAGKGLQVSERQTGKTSIAIVTNAKNPVNELSMEQLRQIFTGVITNWKAVGGPDEPIRVTMRAVPETGTGVLFQQVVLKGEPHAPGAQVMQSYRTTLVVAGKAMAIGYIPTASPYYLKMADEGVKEIKIRLDGSNEAINAPAGIVKDTSFPISIPLVLIWNEKAGSVCIPDFVNFVDNALQKGNFSLSKAGQM